MTYRACEASSVQESGLHEPALQGEVAVQRVRCRRQTLPWRDSRLSAVSQSLLYTLLQPVNQSIDNIV